MTVTLASSEVAMATVSDSADVITYACTVQLSLYILGVSSVTAITLPVADVVMITASSEVMGIPDVAFCHKNRNPSIKLTLTSTVALQVKEYVLKDVALGTTADSGLIVALRGGAAWNGNTADAVTVFSVC